MSFYFFLRKPFIAPLSSLILTLIEVGADQNIIVATPTTLIAILRAVAFSWKQDSLSKSAKEISRLGQELYDRIGIVCDHWNKVGRNLNTAVDAYNQSVASMEARVLVTARKLKESGSISSEMNEPSQIDKLARSHTVITDEKPLLVQSSDEM